MLLVSGTLKRRPSSTHSLEGEWGSSAILGEEGRDSNRQLRSSDLSSRARRALKGLRNSRVRIRSGATSAHKAPATRAAAMRIPARTWMLIGVTPKKVAVSHQASASEAIARWYRRKLIELLTRGARRDVLMSQRGSRGRSADPRSVVSYTFSRCDRSAKLAEGARGMEKPKVDPGPSLGCAQILPPWRSRIDLLTDRPMPMPLGLVV